MKICLSIITSLICFCKPQSNTTRKESSAEFSNNPSHRHTSDQNTGEDSEISNDIESLQLSQANYVMQDLQPKNQTKVLLELNNPNEFLVESIFVKGLTDTIDYSGKVFPGIEGTCPKSGKFSSCTIELQINTNTGTQLKWNLSVEIQYNTRTIKLPVAIEANFLKPFVVVSPSQSQNKITDLSVIELKFSEHPDKNSIPEIAVTNVFGDLITVAVIVDSDTIKITPSETLVRGVDYKVRIGEGLKSLQGQSIDEAIELYFSLSPFLAASSSSFFALSNKGQVYSWGVNTYGELATGDKTNRPNPTKVNLSDIVEIVGGSQHACAIHQDGGVSCWGNNSKAQLGYGADGNLFLPEKVPGVSTVNKLALGFLHSCALSFDGQLSCWGSNEYGALATGGNLPVSGVFQRPGVKSSGVCVDSAVDGGTFLFDEISFERFLWDTNLGVTEMKDNFAKIVHCTFGYDRAYFLTSEKNVFHSTEFMNLRSSFIQKPELDAMQGQFIRIVSGSDRSQPNYYCALTSGKQLMCWGRARAGIFDSESGPGALGATTDVITMIASDVIDVALSHDTLCYVKSDLTTTCGNETQGMAAIVLDLKN